MTKKDGEPLIENRKLLKERSETSKRFKSLRENIDIQISDELKEEIERAMRKVFSEEKKARISGNDTKYQETEWQIRIERTIHYMRIKLCREPSIEEVVREVGGTDDDKYFISSIRDVGAALIPPWEPPRSEDISKGERVIAKMLSSIAWNTYRKSFHKWMEEWRKKEEKDIINVIFRKLKWEDIFDLKISDLEQQYLDIVLKKEPNLILEISETALSNGDLLYEAKWSDEAKQLLIEIPEFIEEDYEEKYHLFSTADGTGVHLLETIPFSSSDINLADFSCLPSNKEKED